ncbi:MAG: hypothetical protein ACREDS_15805, partial [Limisphaerales bacterium]
MIQIRTCAIANEMSRSPCHQNPFLIGSRGRTRTPDAIFLKENHSVFPNEIKLFLQNPSATHPL